MLSTLDTIIAYAVIMTVLGLMITILVQLASAAYSLRGKNLANALSLTFQTIDPKIGDQAHSLAAQILRDPIFSDSLWRNKTGWRSTRRREFDREAPDQRARVAGRSPEATFSQLSQRHLSDGAR